MTYIQIAQDLVEVHTPVTPPATTGETIKWLGRLALPPLPVCPKEPVEGGKSPKQPRFLASNGKTYPVSWSNYKEAMPTQQDIRKWFRYPKGIATIAKFNGKHWITFIDIDRKNFNSQEDCDQQIAAWEERYPITQNMPKFRSQSGGYRYMVASSEEPHNFACNGTFSFNSDDSKGLGEVLCRNGATTILPPTEGLNGAYEWLRFFEYPPVIQQLEDIGIYPLKKEEKPPKSLNNTCHQTDSAFITDDFKTVVEEINSRLTLEAAFNWDGHYFKEDRTKDKVRGNCPWHESSSGSTFYAERKGNGLLWRCPACDLDGDVFSYRSLLSGGNKHPRGKQFVNILKELCDETGVIFSEKTKSKPKLKPKSNSDKKLTATHKDDNEVAPHREISTGQDYDTYRMTTTSDHTIFKSLFESGEGDWTVINDAFYQYSGSGYWRHVEDSEVNHLIAHALIRVYQVKKVGDEEIKEFRFANERNKSGAFKYCKSTLAKKKTLYNNHLSAFLNCTVDLRTGEQLKHDRSHFVIHAIPANYVPNAECPEVFKQFINNAFGEEFTDLIRAVTAMILDPTAPYGYFPHLMGASGSGKGTLLRLWGSMVGEGGVRSITAFSDITTAEGRHQHMTGVRLIKFPDMGGFQGNLRAFYELVDNGAMSGRPLFSSSGYEREWNCRFVMASVTYFSIENSGDGWDRRCILLPTKRRQGELDPDLGRKLQLEKGAIISWALGMIRKERDRLIMNSVSANETIANLKREQSIHSDSVRAFVDMCLRPSDSASAFLENSTLHDWYSAYCKSHGYQSWSYNKFVTHLKNVLPENHVDRRFKRVNGKREITPAHFFHIEGVRGAFIQSSNLDAMVTWQCTKGFCREGGLDTFENFWDNLTQDTTPGTGSILASCANPVPAETPANKEFHQMAQVAHPPGEILYNNSGDLKAEKNMGEVSKVDENTQLKKAEQLPLYIEDFGNPSCAACATVSNSYTASGTGQFTTPPVDPVPPCVACATPEDAKVLASEAIACILESPNPSWEVVKEILSEMEITYSELHGFLTLGEFAQLEMLIPAADREADF